MKRLMLVLLGLALLPSWGGLTTKAGETGRLRLLIETDAGGDPDDEQSLVRFLLYANEWDVEGIIASRARARDKENRNPERTGVGIIRRLVQAYGVCYPKLIQHDPRYPKPEELLRRVVAGYDGEAGMKHILAVVERKDSRPVWYSDWGSDRGAAPNSLKRALDQVLKQRGVEEYARFKNRLRLSSADKFGEHTTRLEPAFALWVDTFRPEQGGRRWYHRFSALTAKAGGFDLKRDVLTGHGPLGALYPTNTTHAQKEGDTMTFLYLVPTGMNDPEEPTWGSWAGRYGRNEEHKGKRYYWANQEDHWEGSTNRDNTLRRWAEHLQNDFRARLDWCVKDYASANHPPQVRVRGSTRREAAFGERIELDGSASTDPDKDRLRFEWVFYPEAGSYRGELPRLEGARSARAWFVMPRAKAGETLHVLLIVTDEGNPPLTRYQRVIVTAKDKKDS